MHITITSGHFKFDLTSLSSLLLKLSDMVNEDSYSRTQLLEIEA